MFQVAFISRLQGIVHRHPHDSKEDDVSEHEENDENASPLKPEYFSDALVDCSRRWRPYARRMI
jgi:hypothetical protein